MFKNLLFMLSLLGLTTGVLLGPLANKTQQLNTNNNFTKWYQVYEINKTNNQNQINCVTLNYNLNEQDISNAINISNATRTFVNNKNIIEQTNSANWIINKSNDIYIKYPLDILVLTSKDNKSTQIFTNNLKNFYPIQNNYIKKQLNNNYKQCAYPGLSDLNLTSYCSSAPPCGTPMVSFNGISAYSNGEYQCTGDSCGGWCGTGMCYQCVELAQRYMNQVYGIAPVWPVNYAKEMCWNYPAGVWETSNPQPGDLIVLGGTWGHVAVITGVDADTIYVIEQNGSPNGQAVYSRWDAECFMTAQ